MFKKILGFLLLTVMMLSLFAGISVLAESTDLVERNIVLNGDMEWLGTSYKMWSGNHDPETNIVHSGSKSMKLTVNDQRLLYSNLERGQGIVPGQTYTFSFCLYADSPFETTYKTDANGDVVLNESTGQPVVNWAGGAGVKLEMLGIKEDSEGNQTSTVVAEIHKTINFTEEQLGKWNQFTYSITAPNGTVSGKNTLYADGTFNIQIRPQGTGTVWYDDISLTGSVTEEFAAEFDAKKARYQEGYDIGQSFYDKLVDYTASAELEPGAKNLITNGDFSLINTSSAPAHKWTASSYLKAQVNAGKYPECTPDDYEVIKRDATTYHSSSYSMSVHRPDGYPVGLNDPYVMQTVYEGLSNCGEDFIPGAQYVLSAWVKTDIKDVSQGAYFKITCTNSTTGGDLSTPRERFTDGEWHQIKYVFTMPEGTTSLKVYARISGKGTVWYDDISIGRANSNRYLEFNSKHTFYYTDEPEIEAWTDFNSNIFDIEDGSQVKFSLVDENGNVVISESFDAAKHNSWTFPSSLLATKKATYTIMAEYILSDGTIVNTHSKRIYRYDRPTSMDKDGNIHDTETGEIIPPFFMYGSTYDTYDELTEAGLVIIRPNEMSLNDDAAIKKHLDALHEKGTKALVALYGTVAGHPSQIETTRHVVSTFYTHPAVVAWMLMDEPSLHVTSLGIRTYDEMLYYLEEGYKAVRDIDPIHPVYNIETVGQSNDSYERTSQMCDIFAIDPYPSGLSTSIGGSLSRATTRAINAVYNERPVWVLGLAANWSGNYGAPVTSAMLRYQLYDALWSGAKGAGHYLSDDPNFTDPTFSETYFDTFKKATSSGEIDEIFDHFSADNSPTWAEGSGDGYEWQSWLKDNGDIYLAVRSRISDKTVIDSLVTDIKLANDNISIDGFDAVLVNGASEKEIHSSGSTLAITLLAGEVSLYKITPVENIRFDVIPAEKRPMDYGSELVKDGDFESGLASQFKATNGSAGLTNTDPGNGTSSLQLVPSGTSKVSYKSSNVSVEGNRPFELSFMMKTTSLAAETEVPLAKLVSGYGTLTYSLHNSYLYNGEWKLYKKVFTVPEGALALKLEFVFPAACGDVFLDDISFRQVTSYNEDQLITNLSFEDFSLNSNYTSSNGTYPTNWTTSSKTYANVYITDDSVVTPHSGNYSIGINAASLQHILTDVKYGETYEFSVWFNAKNMADETTHPHLTIQTRTSEGTYDKSVGCATAREYFYDSYLNKDKGWYKLTVQYTVPEYQDGYDIKSAVVTLNVAGDAIGYFDDATFNIVSEKEGYTLRNLTTTADAERITIEYDVINHFTKDGGTIIYAFYDAEGRFVKMEKEEAVFDSIHITRTFDKIDFASVKVFIWDALGGLVPYSNMAE